MSSKSPHAPRHFQWWRRGSRGNLTTSNISWNDNFLIPFASWIMYSIFYNCAERKRIFNMIIIRNICKARSLTYWREHLFLSFVACLFSSLPGTQVRTFTANEGVDSETEYRPMFHRYPLTRNPSEAPDSEPENGYALNSLILFGNHHFLVPWYFGDSWGGCRWCKCTKSIQWHTHSYVRIGKNLYMQRKIFTYIILYVISLYFIILYYIILKYIILCYITYIIL